MRFGISDAIRSPGVEAEARVVAGQAVAGVLELAPRHLVDRARHRHRVGLGVEPDAEEVAQVDRRGEWASLERHPASCDHLASDRAAGPRGYDAMARRGALSYGAAHGD